MKVKSKNLDAELFAKRWPDPEVFLQCVLNENHPLWGPGGAGREFARDILLQTHKWEWLSYRVDDFAMIIEESMRKKIPKWVWRSQFELGGLSKHNQSTEAITKWLLDRYVAELKNLFDTRYYGHLKLDQCFSYQQTIIYQ